MNLKNCPYDSTKIEIDGYEGGVYLISCPACNAQWESHGGWIARVTEPDWDIVKTFQEIDSLQSTTD